ncbi:MAG: helix-turn-helix domain-containing protein [Candidatus Omnitrophica bacterium]|nr:helix-turn-helix domain-containing protein [Candidatus Omnitrophota bacterium]
MRRVERREAVQLRRDGVSYHELLGRFGIAKSTLWRWLRAEGLVATQPQRLTTELRRLAQQRGAAIVKARRIERSRVIIEEARGQVGSLSPRELWLIGTALYWAEGAKQKDATPSEGVVFSNTDPAMLRLFVRFLTECCGVCASSLRFRLCIHEQADPTVAKMFWFNELGIETIQTAPVSWKRHQPVTRRTNVGERYHGLLRIAVGKSTDLNRRIRGWIDGVCATVGE